MGLGGLIAGDIVLLPSQEVMEAALRLNQALRQRFEPKIVLNMNDCLPHLSLAMGCLREEEVPAVANLLEEIGAQFPPIGLEWTEIRAGALATGESVSTLAAARTAELQRLHERVIDRTAPYFRFEATAAAFAGFPSVEPTSVDWVNAYRTAASFERFSPHTTLGIGTVESAPLPLSSDAGRLALCHLGNYCTCRTILFETALRGKVQ